MTTWYSTIAKDISKLDDCESYYNNELVEARKECVIRGNIERLASDLPTYIEIRYSQLQDVEAILELLNIKLRKLRSEKFKAYLEHYNRALSGREAEKYIDGEDDVEFLAEYINRVALLRNGFLGILKGLENKSWQLNNIVKLRSVGIQDATIE